MATVLEDCTTEEQSSVVLFLRAKGLKTKDIHKETFPRYSGKYLSLKAVHIWVEKNGKFSLMTERLKRRRGSGPDNSKNFYAAGFVLQIKRWEKFINIDRKYVQK
jgi:hypothetical protein